MIDLQNFWNNFSTYKSFPWVVKVEVFFNDHLCFELIYLSLCHMMCVGSAVKNLPANSEDTRDVSLISWSGRSPVVGNGTSTRKWHSSTLAWKIPWTEQPGGLLSMGSQSIGQDWVTNPNTHSVIYSNSFQTSIKRACSRNARIMLADWMSECT